MLANQDNIKCPSRKLANNIDIQKPLKRLWCIVCVVYRLLRVAPNKLVRTCHNCGHVDVGIFAADKHLSGIVESVPQAGDFNHHGSRSGDVGGTRGEEKGEEPMEGSKQPSGSDPSSTSCDPDYYR